ncbi:hypothetical protein [Mastigocoleus testarum]|uniref:hypothetical protein n=1 Tax=Mastigocoleus testarum TaxID=996925 RepID=UPI00137B381E|nr:hypothetical protein [Mastigocoleus testarum]
MREGSVGGVGSVGGNPKKYKGVLKIGFGIRWKRVARPRKRERKQRRNKNIHRTLTL